MLLYTGHGETVGSDARYFLDLNNNINKDKKYELIAFADKNEVFGCRAGQWLREGITRKLDRYAPKIP